MEWAIGGFSACCAGVITNPLDVIKTRLQLQGELKKRGHYTVHYKSIFHAVFAIAKADGLFALQKGLVPALWYQFLMNGTRLGTYDFIEKRGFTYEGNEISAMKSVALGAFSGCIGAFVGSPFYMLKTQLQSQSAECIAVGYQHHHHSMTEAFHRMYSEHGVLSLWRGVGAAMARVSCGSAVQLTTFSKSKELIQNSEIFTENSWLNSLAASMLSGVMVANFMTPLDVMSTRLYNQGVDSTGKGLQYNGLLDCIIKTVKTESILGFYKGYFVLLIRTGPHTILNLVFWDILRKFYVN